MQQKGVRYVLISLAKLEELEWSGNDNDFDACCPVCGGLRLSKSSFHAPSVDDGTIISHTKDCWLAALLREAR